MSINVNDRCTGCTACYAACPMHCIEMVSDTNGFRYPFIKKDKCINCEVCSHVCPLLHSKVTEDTRVSYAAVNNDKLTKINSSSGGIFTLLANEILRQDGVVFGAAFGEDYSVRHCYVESKENLNYFQGAKYVQSDLGNTFLQVKDFLEQGRVVLFSGTPCQVGGLLSFLKKTYGNLYTQDLICHGIPSPKIWSKYLEYIKTANKDKIISISHKNKDNGWRNPFVKIRFENGEEYYKKASSDLYLRLFQENLSLRDSCYDCAFKGQNHMADITLADFWGVENIIPDLDDDKGTSLVITNTNKGNKLFGAIKSDIEYKKVSLKDSVKYNPCYFQSVRKPTTRELFLKDVSTDPFEAVVKKYCKESFISRLKRTVKRILNL